MSQASKLSGLSSKTTRRLASSPGGTTSRVVVLVPEAGDAAVLVELDVPERRFDFARAMTLQRRLRATRRRPTGRGGKPGSRWRARPRIHQQAAVGGGLAGSG